MCVECAKRTRTDVVFVGCVRDAQHLFRLLVGREINCVRWACTGGYRTDPSEECPESFRARNRDQGIHSTIVRCSCLLGVVEDVGLTTNVVCVCVSYV